MIKSLFSSFIINDVKLKLGKMSSAAVIAENTAVLFLKEQKFKTE